MISGLLAARNIDDHDTLKPAHLWSGNTDRARTRQAGLLKIVYTRLQRVVEPFDGL